MPLPPPSLKGRALRLLSLREHSRSELDRKLRVHETASGELARALDDLQAKGLINEQRVIESVVHRRSGKLGAARIRQELLGKGLPPAAVKEAVRGLQATEIERARAVWRRKFGVVASTSQASGISAADRARQARFLGSRGFGTETIRRVVSGALEDGEPAS